MSLREGTDEDEIDSLILEDVAIDVQNMKRRPKSNNQKHKKKQKTSKDKESAGGEKEA